MLWKGLGYRILSALFFARAAGKMENCSERAQNASKLDYRKRRVGARMREDGSRIRGRTQFSSLMTDFHAREISRKPRRNDEPRIKTFFTSTCDLSENTWRKASKGHFEITSEWSKMWAKIWENALGENHVQSPDLWNRQALEALGEEFDHVYIFILTFRSVFFSLSLLFTMHSIQSNGSFIAKIGIEPFQIF